MLFVLCLQLPMREKSADAIFVACLLLFCCLFFCLQPPMRGVGRCAVGWVRRSRRRRPRTSTPRSARASRGGSAAPPCRHSQRVYEGSRRPLSLSPQAGDLWGGVGVGWGGGGGETSATGMHTEDARAKKCGRIEQAHTRGKHGQGGCEQWVRGWHVTK